MGFKQLSFGLGSFHVSGFTTDRFKEPDAGRNGNRIFSLVSLKH